MRRLALTTAITLIGSPVLASEPGSGTYGATCEDGDTLYTIAIAADGSGAVQSGETTFTDLLTSYSYYGDATPADFHIAVMFDPDAAPFAPGEDGDARIELWKGEAAYYGVLNGDTSQRLLFCGE